MAFLAGFVAAHRNARFRSEIRFFELQCQIFPQIGAALHAIATASSTTAKHVAKAEEFAENVAEVLKDSGIKASALRRRTAETGVSVAIVDRALFRIGEHGIRFADFFELLFRVRIVRISVRMILQSQLAVSGLEFDLSDRSGNTQYFVVIAFSVRSQNLSFH